MRITTKLTLLLLIAGLIPFIFITYFDYNYSVKNITKEIANNLTTATTYRVKIMNLLIEEMRKDIEISAQSPLFAIKLKDPKKYKSDIQFQKSFQTMTKVPVIIHKLHDVLLIAKSGDIVNTIAKESNRQTNLYDDKYKNNELAKCFRNAINLKQTCISNISYYKPSKKLALFITTPIFKDKKIIGVLAFQLNITQFYSLLDDYEGLGNTGEIIIASKVDDKALFLNQLRYEEGVAFKRFVKLGSKDALPIQKAVNGGKGSGIYNDCQQKEVIAAWDYIDSLKLGIVLKIDTQEAYKTIRTLKNCTILIGFIALGIFLYVLWYAQRILLKSELKQEQYESAISGANDGLWDWNLEKDTIYFSPRWKEMIGYKDNEFENSFSEWKLRAHPDDLEQVYKDVQAAQASEDVEYKNIHRLKHKNGQWVYILNRAKTIFKNGKAIRMIGFHTDITELILKENELNETKTLLLNILNSAGNIIFVKDKDFRYIECNSEFEKFVGLSRSELIGKSDYDLFDKDEADFYRKKDEDMLASNQTKSNYEWVTYPDGHKVYLLTIKSILKNHNGDKIGLVGNSIDVTKQIELHKKLKSQEDIIIIQSRHAAMGEMISMIAHQWRQPISIIAMGANNIIADIDLDLLDNDTLKHNAQGIINQTKELSKTIDDFRNFFKPDKKIQKSKISDIVNDVFAVIEKSLQSANIEVILTNNKQDIELTTYPRELMQVLINILKNAKDAFVEKKIENKSIELSIVSDTKNIEVKICDNAGGIQEDIITKIFDPYFSTKHQSIGTGIGLYMSKTIIEKHLNGVLTAYNIKNSNNNIVGACFSIKLPIMMMQEVAEI